MTCFSRFPLYHKMYFFLYLVFILQLVLNKFIVGENNDTVNCTDYKQNFGSAISNFSLCAISNSHPIKLCESCIDAYMEVIDSYKNLSKYKDDKGVCISHYINLDRLGIIINMYESVYNLWNNAKCYECYVVENNMLTHNLSSETIKFNEFYNSTQICMDKKYPTTSAMCETCMDSYLDLNNYYNSISDENAKIGMCMDVVDMMNTTRTLWSEKCCHYRRHPEYIFIASAVAIMIITILFYVLTKLLIDKISPKIITQNRFAESLSSSSRR